MKSYSNKNCRFGSSSRKTDRFGSFPSKNCGVRNSSNKQGKVSTVKRGQSHIGPPSRSDTVHQISLQKCVFSFASNSFDEDLSSAHTERNRYVSKVVDNKSLRPDTATTDVILDMPVPSSDLRAARAPLDSSRKKDGIFGSKNELSGCTSGRLNGWATAQNDSALQVCKQIAGNSALGAHSSYDFTVKHIKGSSNSTADSLSRLPVCTPGSTVAQFPEEQSLNAKIPDPIKRMEGVLKEPVELPEAPTVNKVDITVEEGEIMSEVMELASYPCMEVVNASIAQLVGDVPAAAWDILPLTMKEVAEATKVDKVYGKLYRAVKSGVLNTKDKDLGKFNGVFE